VSENPRTFRNADEFIKEEYDFQEKQDFGKRIGTCDVVTVDKSALSFKSKPEQLAAETLEIIDKL
jgi:hypothetical protein